MRFLLVPLIVALLLPVGGTFAPAEAAKSSACTWHVWFTGVREVALIHPWYQRYTASPCFASQSACKAWLYKVQTAYPLMMNFRPCYRG